VNITKSRFLAQGVFGNKTLTVTTVLVSKCCAVYFILLIPIYVHVVYEIIKFNVVKNLRIIRIPSVFCMDNGNVHLN